MVRALCPDYEWPEAWGLMAEKERQQYFHDFRARLQWFWQKRAEYEKERAERMEKFKYD